MKHRKCIVIFDIVKKQEQGWVDGVAASYLHSRVCVLPTSSSLTPSGCVSSFRPSTSVLVEADAWPISLSINGAALGLEVWKRVEQ